MHTTVSATSFKLATAASNVTVVAGLTFANPGNTLVEDDTVASGTTTTKNAEAYVLLENFGFGLLIPSTATINQVNLRHRGARTAGASDHSAYIYRAGTAGAASANANTALTTVTANSYARPGGGTWVPDDFSDANFKVRLRSLQPNNTTSRTYQWAWGEVQVVFTFEDSVEFPYPEWDPGGELSPPGAPVRIITTSIIIAA